MSYGFTAVNDNGKVIINDTLENLHFIGKATQTNTSMAYNDFPTYSGANDTLDGVTIFTFTITCSGTPVAFIKPTDYDRWHSIVKQSVSGTTWTFEVLGGGESTSNAPELYVFVNADDIPTPSDTHGLLVYKADGTTKTFDSRRQPLAITGGGSAVSPSDPTNSSGLPGTSNNQNWQSATLDHDFRSSNQYNTYSDTGCNTTNAMFACPSLAQGVYSRVINGYKCSNHPYPQSGCQEHWSTAWWWVMYRAAFRIQTNEFQAGWNCYQAGYFYSENYNSGGWFGSGGGGYQAGNAPYGNKIINLSSNAYIIADSSRFD